MNYLVVLEEEEDLGFRAYLPDLPGCTVIGAKHEEVLRLIRQAVVLHIRALRDKGLPVPRPKSFGQLVRANGNGG